jgi:ribosomal-protein-alanine N-acetyltransferase
LTIGDLPLMRAIEEASFSTPWPGNAYESELTTNRLARYVGAWRGGELLGFGGIWLMLELLQEARRGEARVATLDVRVSNELAQRLYARLGFAEAGRRVRYYEESGEDAIIMTTPELSDRGQQAREALAHAATKTDEPLPNPEAFDVVAR